MYESGFNVFNMGYASAIGVVLIIILGILSAVQLWREENRESCKEAHMGYKAKRRWDAVLVYGALTVISLICIFPIAWMCLISLKPATEVSADFIR